MQNNSTACDLKWTNMFDELSTAFSQERLNRYLQFENNKQNAVISYSWNIALSQSLYPAIQILEVSIRNALHNAMSDYFQTDIWYDNAFLYASENIAVKQAKKKLANSKKSIEPGRVIAELSFGFWTSLFDVRYEHDQILWPQLLKPTFRFMPKSHRTRAFVSRKLNQVRWLRNRIFHYEPIWHWQNLKEQHTDIVTMIKWISPKACEYLALLDPFQEIHLSGKSDIAEKLDHVVH